MFNLTKKQILVALLVITVLYLVYTKYEGFDNERKHHPEHHVKYPKHHLERHNMHHLDKHQMHHLSVPVSSSVSPTVLSPVSASVPLPVSVPASTSWGRYPGHNTWGLDLYQTRGTRIEDCENVCAGDPFCWTNNW